MNTCPIECTSYEITQVLPTISDYRDQPEMNPIPICNVSSLKQILKI